MSTRITERSQKTHNALIQALAERYEKDGYFVRADHISHPNGSPPTINGYVPDIAAYKDNTLKIIAEAETCDSISDTSTREQWEAFAKSPYLFEIIVPKSCLEEAQRQANLWGIRVDRWWWLDI
jgi:hypothetical protein